MAKLKIVYWPDIPGRVVVREGRRNTRIRLSPRFMKAIERASYRLKKHDKDALFEPWRDVDQPFTGDIREHCFFMFHGTGANGKTTTIKTFINVLEDYALQSPVETFYIKNSPS